MMSNMKTPLVAGGAAVAATAVTLGCYAWQKRYETNRLQELARRQQVLLALLSDLSAVEIPVKDHASQILVHARRLVNSDRFALFMYDREEDALDSVVLSDSSAQLSFPATKGIAGFCVRSGRPYVCNDTAAETHFNSEADAETGYHTHTVLSVPIISHGSVIAVAQLVNKLPVGSLFLEEDVETMKQFSDVLAIVLRNKSVYAHLSNISEERSALFTAATSGFSSSSMQKRRFSAAALRGLDAATQSGTAVEEVLRVVVSDDELAELRSVDFDILKYDNDKCRIPALVLAFIHDLGRDVPLLRKISDETWVHLILAVRQTYRNVPYHNFNHAFDVTHAIYLLLTQGALATTFTEVEVLVLIVVGLFHDCDHMGLNNGFHAKAETPLGILSDITGSQSVLETHHCNVAIDVMSNDKCNVFSSLSPSESSHAWRLVIDCILATDMARHKAQMDEFAALGNAWDNKKDDKQRAAIMRLIVKAADISNSWKPRPLNIAWTQLVSEEFFCQGDVERASGLDVAPMFDRNNMAQVSSEHDKLSAMKKSALGFIAFVAEPYYRVVVDVVPSLQFTLDGLIANKQFWEAIV
eukprot:PhM_4_TR2861/c0_g1_i1/m.54782/K18438/PDE10; cAMP and cAMP-inhibited cGMP 3',5'-cyclic phosphodiesterase 10